VIFVDPNSARPFMDPSYDLRVHDYAHDSEHENHNLGSPLYQGANGKIFVNTQTQANPVIAINVN